MFHAIYVIGIMLVIPILCIAVEYVSKKKNLLYILCKWFGFWTIGIRAATTGLMQIFNPSYTAELLQLNLNNNIIIQELGFAQLSIGIIGICSLKVITFRKSAAVSYGIFMLGAVVLHMSRLSIVNLGEVISLIGDLFVIIITIICIFQKENTAPL